MVLAPILVGTDRYEPEGRYSDTVVWEPRRGRVHTYARQQPAPFGEYVPLRGPVRVLSSQVDRLQGTGGPAQSTLQLAMSWLRAVETGRATIQAPTGGVSAVIAPDGTVVQRTGLFTSATITADLPLRTSLTPAIRVGAASAHLEIGLSGHSRHERRDRMALSGRPT